MDEKRKLAYELLLPYFIDPATCGMRQLRVDKDLLYRVYINHFVDLSEPEFYRTSPAFIHAKAILWYTSQSYYSFIRTILYNENYETTA
jgi:hypothetical protein